jgi:hypothetical protein
MMQIQKVVIEKQELEKKVEEGLELEGYTEILQDIKSLLEKASDLDIAKRNLHNTVRFYRVYPIVQTVSAQLSWSHFVELIYLDNKEERQFYEQHTIQNAWSVRELRRQIRSHLYERAKGRGEITIIQPIAKALQPEQVFKDKWQEGQRQPIGLIVCRTKDEETVHYALGDLKKEIFIYFIWFK